MNTNNFIKSYYRNKRNSFIWIVNWIPNNKNKLQLKNIFIQEILSNLYDKNGIINKITEKLSYNANENSEQSITTQTNIVLHMTKLKNIILNEITKIKKLDVEYKKQTNTQTHKNNNFYKFNLYKIQVIIHKPAPITELLTLICLFNSEKAHIFFKTTS